MVITVLKQNRINVGIIETKNIVIIFLLNGTNERYFLVWVTKRTFKSITDNKVAKEAPIKPFELSKKNKKGIGTNIEFNNKFAVADIIILNIINLDLPNIEIRLFETTNKEEIKDPISNNLRAFCATRYCDPKRKFNVAPGKENIKIKIGRTAINIHLFTCLLSCFISSWFFA